MTSNLRTNMVGEHPFCDVGSQAIQVLGAGEDFVGIGIWLGLKRELLALELGANGAGTRARDLV